MTHISDEAVALLPCPFCGGKADYFANGSLSQPDIIVHRVLCNCEMQPFTDWRATKSEAIAAWNRRTPSREAVLEEAAKVAERDVDWTMFARQPKKDWKTGEETNVFAPMDDPDNTIPTPVNVFAYANGIAAGRAIAAAIRSLSKPSESAT